MGENSKQQAAAQTRRGCMGLRPTLNMTRSAVSNTVAGKTFGRYQGVCGNAADGVGWGGGGGTGGAWERTPSSKQQHKLGVDAWV